MRKIFFVWNFSVILEYQIKINKLSVQRLLNIELNLELVERPDFLVEDLDRPPGFWSNFFRLKPRQNTEVFLFYRFFDVLNAT